MNPYKYIPLYEIVKAIVLKLWFWRKKNHHCDFKKDSLRFVNAWKKQFFLKDFEEEWSLLNKNSYEESKEILHSIVDFCVRYGFKPVIVLPPISKELREHFSKNALERCIIDYVRETVGDKVPFLNYIDDASFNDNTLFMNSYFLNKKGAKLFTNTLIQELSKLQ